MKIAIIGAGLSGITAARTLTDTLGSKAEITIIEKSRGAGGRMSTRRADDFEFDHGAQYFTAKDPGFKIAVDVAIGEGHVAPWNGTAKYLKKGSLQIDTGGARYVSTPRMNSWIKAMAGSLNLQTSSRVSGLIKTAEGWTLAFENNTAASGFEAVICAVPSPQAEALLEPIDFKDLGRIKSSQMEACFAVMLGFSQAQSLPWDTLRSADGPASWIAVNSAKPGRPETGTTLMVHSGPDWSNMNVDRDKTLLQSEIIEAATELTGLDLSRADYVTIHRWLYAAVSKGAGQPCLADQERKIVACGDWCLGGRVEGAWLSGKAAAEYIIDWSKASA